MRCAMRGDVLHGLMGPDETAEDRAPARPGDARAGAPAPDRTAVRIESAGGDPEQALADLTPLYEGMRWSSRRTEGAYDYRYAAVGDAALTLRTSRISGSIRGEIPPGDEMVVQWIGHGSGVIDPDGDALVMRPGAPTLFPVHRPFVFEYTDYDQRIVHLDRALVEGVAAERLAVPSGGFRFDHRRTPSPAAVALWNDTVGLVSRTLARGEVGELLWSELTRLTAVGLLELYPPSAADLPVALLEPGARRIRRVVEHIHEHAELPLTPTDLARVADVSVRTLQESFAAVLGQSPMGYVRGVRLDRARDELRAGVPGTSVGRVAQRWGFAHLGRFSAEYGRRFGERPSDTLRR